MPALPTASAPRRVAMTLPRVLDRGFPWALVARQLQPRAEAELVRQGNQQLRPDDESVRFHGVCLLRTVVCAEGIDSRKRERTSKETVKDSKVVSARANRNCGGFVAALVYPLVCLLLDQTSDSTTCPRSNAALLSEC